MTDVQHLAEQQRFVIHYEGGEAVMSYHLFRQGNTLAIDFNSTYVPAELRGKGLAEKLVRTGLVWARGEALTITASCWYVDKWLQRGMSN